LIRVIEGLKKLQPMSKNKVLQQDVYEVGTREQFAEKSIVLGSFATYNVLYDPKHMGFILARYKFVAKMFNGFDYALEVGCGDAFGTPIVAQHVKRVIAIDSDARHIRSNKKRLRNLENIQFSQGLIQNFKSTEKLFDGSYSIDVIEHLDGQLNDLFIESQVRKLKGNGVCIVGTPNITANKYASETSRVQHINMHSQKTLNALMSKYFDRVFMFGMNDEVLHIGYAPMCHYIFGMGVGLKRHYRLQNI